MKVLISGSTSQQIGNGTRLGYGPVIDLFAAAIRDAGADVEHRRLVPEEDINDYDCLLIGMAPFNGLNATYLYGMLDAIRRARASKVGLVLYVDDWQIPLLKTGIRTQIRQPERLAREAIRTARRDLDWGMAHLDELMTVVHAFNDRPWPTTLAPKFEWGNADGLFEKLPTRKRITIDPSAYAVEYPTQLRPDAERYGAWVLGILSDQRAWVEKLGLSWPVSYVGGKKSKADAPMKEIDLVQRYADCWGVLSPPYKALNGTGWWRNRYVYAARTGAVLLGDPAEVGLIGDAYLTTPDVVESLGVPQLRELADAQRAQLESWQWSKERVRDTIMAELKLAVEEARA